MHLLLVRRLDPPTLHRHTIMGMLISRSTFEVDIGFAYVVDGSSVLRDLDHLDGNVVADIEGNVRHKRYLG